MQVSQADRGVLPSFDRPGLIHKLSVGIALQGNSRHTAPGGRYVYGDVVAITDSSLTASANSVEFEELRDDWKSEPRNK